MPSFRALFVCALAGAATACGVLLGTTSDPSSSPTGADASGDAVAIDGAGQDATPPELCNDPRAICETFDVGDASGYFVPKNGIPSIVADFATTPPSSFRAETEAGIGNNEASYQRFFDPSAMNLDCTFAAKILAADPSPGDITFFRLQAGFDDAGPGMEFFSTLSTHEAVISGRVHSSPIPNNDGNDFYGNLPLPEVGEWIRYHVKIHVAAPDASTGSDLTVDAVHLDGGAPLGSFTAALGAQGPPATITSWKLRFGLIFTNSPSTSIVQIDDVYCLPTP